MAKKTTEKATEKKEFAWDTEKVIGGFEDAKKKMEVRICTLNGKTYVSSQNYVMSAKTNDWKRTKNNTIEMSVFKQLQELVGDWEMTEAFGSTTELKAPEKKVVKTGRMETAYKQEEAPAKSGGLKAKKQAEGAKAKTTRKKKAE